MAGGKRSLEPIIALVDEYIVGSTIIVLILYALERENIISFRSFILLSLVLIGIILFVTWRIVVVYKREAAVGPESLLGKEARVVEDLDPSGIVEVEGELWKAISLTGEPVRRGSTVRIVDYKGLTLIVAPSGGKDGL